MEINGEDVRHLTHPLLIVHDRAYASLSELSAYLGKKVEWLPEQKKIRIADEDEDTSKILIPFYDAAKGKYGYKDHDGNPFVEPKFDAASAFREGRAVVGNRDSDGYMKYGYIDDKGDVVIPIQYYIADDFSNGVASVGVNIENPEMYYIKQDGSMLFNKRYLCTTQFHEGFACVMTKKNYDEFPKKFEKWSFIDMTGELVTDLEFDKKAYFKNGYANVVLNGVEGYIDTSFNFFEGKR